MSASIARVLYLLFSIQIPLLIIYFTDLNKFSQLNKCDLPKLLLNLIVTRPSKHTCFHKSFFFLSLIHTPLTTLTEVFEVNKQKVDLNKKT